MTVVKGTGCALRLVECRHVAREVDGRAPVADWVVQRLVSEQPCAVGASGSWCSVVSFRRRSAVRGQRAQALERVYDRPDPGPVGGQVQRGFWGVAGELPGDVQDAVAQSLGFCEPVLAVEVHSCVQTITSWPVRANSNHAAFALKEWNGRCEAPVAFSVSTRSSTSAC